MALSFRIDHPVVKLMSYATKMLRRMGYFRLSQAGGVRIGIGASTEPAASKPLIPQFPLLANFLLTAAV